MLNIQTLTAPAYWASALVNGDYSSLTTEECQHVAHWLKLNRVHAVLCDAPGPDGIEGNPQEPRFTWHFQLYDPLADCTGGDVLDFTCDCIPEA